MFHIIIRSETKTQKKARDEEDYKLIQAAHALHSPEYPRYYHFERFVIVRDRYYANRLKDIIRFNYKGEGKRKCKGNAKSIRGRLILKCVR